MQKQAMRMTSSLVSQALMDATWQRIGGGVSGKEVLRLQQACGKEQEELTGFVIGFSSKLSPEAIGLTLYAHIVIAEAFRRSGAKFRVIKAAKILRTWESAEEMVTSLKDRGRSAAEQHAALTSEPAVFHYILGALSEDQDNNDPVPLTDDEFWHMLCILQTVSDCLHDAKKSR
jgi:hypothetical protein